jgi:hypothetical protein
MIDIHVILSLGAGIGTGLMIGFYHLERHVCITHQIKMSRTTRTALYGVVLIVLFPLMVTPLYYHFPIAARIGMGRVLSYNPFMSERLLEAAHNHHQELKQAGAEARDNLVMRRT